MHLLSAQAGRPAGQPATAADGNTSAGRPLAAGRAWDGVERGSGPETACQLVCPAQRSRFGRILLVHIEESAKSGVSLRAQDEGYVQQAEDRANHDAGRGQPAPALVAALDLAVGDEPEQDREQRQTGQ